MGILDTFLIGIVLGLAKFIHKHWDDVPYCHYCRKEHNNYNHESLTDWNRRD